MRQVLGVVLLLNGIAIVVAAFTGNLPGWPPGQADIHVAEQAGTPLIHLGGEEHASEGGVISIWNDISISNSIFTMWLVMAILAVIGVLASRAVSEVPGRFQGAIELMVQGLVGFMREAGGPAVVRYLPLFGTLFLFALVSNWLFLIPLVGQIGLLHVPTADYHTNLGLALTGFIWYQAAGIRKNGLSYFTRWFNFTAFKEGALVGVVMIFVGIIELFSELFRVLTLTLRLWGNVWGGEIVLAVLAALLFVPSLVLPFVGLELFIGFIQAFVFAFLVLLYIILALESHGGEEHEAHPNASHAAHPEASHAAHPEASHAA
ncbi:MAG TPA: F0F1 ATP synthase subunit A [Candidatus Limnocylindria bacterium]|nr:F0F1 ATP synthase subunit A [Candidatus Limnocylindria bacterium]